MGPLEPYKDLKAPQGPCKALTGPLEPFQGLIRLLRAPQGPYKDLMSILRALSLKGLIRHLKQGRTGKHTLRAL